MKKDSIMRIMLDMMEAEQLRDLIVTILASDDAKDLRSQKSMEEKVNEIVNEHYSQPKNPKFSFKPFFKKEDVAHIKNRKVTIRDIANIEADPMPEGDKRTVEYREWKKRQDPNAYKKR